jgi:hypothetical protein
METKLKHLEFIQGAISRMAQNSFLFKGWAITVAAGLSAFGGATSRDGLLAVALASTLMFWCLDGYYLWLERGFIALHTEVAAKEEGQIDFSMRIDKSNAFCNWLATCFRPHLWIFYGTLVAVDVVGIVVLRGSS